MIEMNTSIFNPDMKKESSDSLKRVFQKSQQDNENIDALGDAFLSYLPNIDQ